jgi:hypothetical protein
MKCCLNLFTSRSIASGFVSAYTRMVWAESYAVGCAVSKCKKDPVYKAPLIHYACNFAPGGNLVGSPVYKIGKAASNCPGGTKPNDGLCF